MMPRINIQHLKVNLFYGQSKSSAKILKLIIDSCVCQKIYIKLSKKFLRFNNTYLHCKFRCHFGIWERKLSGTNGTVVRIRTLQAYSRTFYQNFRTAIFIY